MHKTESWIFLILSFFSIVGSAKTAGGSLNPDLFSTVVLFGIIFSLYSFYFLFIFKRRETSNLTAILFSVHFNFMIWSGLFVDYFDGLLVEKTSLYLFAAFVIGMITIYAKYFNEILIAAGIEKENNS